MKTVMEDIKIRSRHGNWHAEDKYADKKLQRDTKNEGLNRIANQEFNHTVTHLEGCEIFPQRTSTIWLVNTDRGVTACLLPTRHRGNIILCSELH